MIENTKILTIYHITDIWLFTMEIKFENYMDKLTKEYIELLSNENRNASDKFWEIEKRIKQDKKHPGVIMEMRKSEAIWNIVYLIRLGVIEYNDLADFTDDLKQAVKMILDESRG